MDIRPYLDYLIYREEVRNYFTLYYDSEVRTGPESTIVVPSARKNGYLIVGENDFPLLGFFDWVALITKASMFVKENLSARLHRFNLAHASPHQDLLEASIEVELNEKALALDIISRDACQMPYLALDLEELGRQWDIDITRVAVTFESIYEALLKTLVDSDGEDDGKRTGPAITFSFERGSASGLDDSMVEGSPEVSDDEDTGEGEGDAGEEEDTESGGECEDSGDGEEDLSEQVASDEDDSHADDREGDGDEAVMALIEHLDGYDDPLPDVVPQEAQRENFVTGQMGGYALGGGGGGVFKCAEGTPLEDLVALIIKTARGEGKKRNKRASGGRRSVYHWGSYHVRLADVQEKFGDSAVLPPKKIKRNPNKEGKFKVVIYLDTSASCAYRSQAFFRSVTNMNQDMFDITLYSFADRVMSHNVIEREFRYRSGGTNIQAVLDSVEENNHVTDSDAIIVLTDADFSSVKHNAKIQNAEKWHWVLTNGKDHFLARRNLPDESRRYSFRQ